MIGTGSPSDNNIEILLKFLSVFARAGIEPRMGSVVKNALPKFVVKPPSPLRLSVIHWYKGALVAWKSLFA